MSQEEEQSITGENLWAVLDMDEKVVQGGFESEEAAEIWTTTEDGKKAVDKSGGNFTVAEISVEDLGSESGDMV